MITDEEIKRIEKIVKAYGYVIKHWDLATRTFKTESNSDRGLERGFLGYYSFLSSAIYQYSIDVDRRFSFQIQDYTGFNEFYSSFAPYIEPVQNKPRDHIKFLDNGSGVAWVLSETQVEAMEAMSKRNKSLLLNLFLGLNNLYITDLYLLLLCGSKYEIKKCLKDYDAKDKKPKHKPKLRYDNPRKQQYLGKNGVGLLRNLNNYLKPKLGSTFLRQPIKF